MARRAIVLLIAAGVLFAGCSSAPGPGGPGSSMADAQGTTIR